MFERRLLAANPDRDVSVRGAACQPATLTIPSIPCCRRDVEDAADRQNAEFMAVQREVRGEVFGGLDRLLVTEPKCGPLNAECPGRRGAGSDESRLDTPGLPTYGWLRDLALSEGID
jgi:hypothetical protein